MDASHDEMLNAHFVAGDGRVNENIGLNEPSAQIFPLNTDDIAPGSKDSA